MAFRRPYVKPPKADPIPMRYSTAHVRQAAVTARCVVVPKSEPARHEGYRRLVALLPCHLCGIEWYSQAAHSNHGKGLALKSDDRECFAMCGPRPGNAGCHAGLDQGAIFSKAERRAFEQQAAQATRERIRAMGIWPADLAGWPADMEQTA